MITVGGVDTYYDYDEQQWKYRRLGGGPVRLKSSRSELSGTSAEKDAEERQSDSPAPREPASQP
ncbi:hypothetical protein E0H75_40660 [Kribbella capetownensis]|uniref:Uncharacterized protein n=1 Tax=Kribbella capetownensis TaxID=1572659 RepID=A0A4R0IW67_9ACTN|nr:hypothetical protein [Kribbella capetownensis]TCC37457.1 hypothetical protein E0H75_40660 [Kribbella capetownensis]